MKPFPHRLPIKDTKQANPSESLQEDPSPEPSMGLGELSSGCSGGAAAAADVVQVDRCSRSLTHCARWDITL